MKRCTLARRRARLGALVPRAVALASRAAVGRRAGGTPRSTTVGCSPTSSFAASKAVLADFTKQTGYKVKLLQPGDAGGW